MEDSSCSNGDLSDLKEKLRVEIEDESKKLIIDHTIKINQRKKRSGRWKVDDDFEQAVNRAIQVLHFQLNEFQSYHQYILEHLKENPNYFKEQFDLECKRFKSALPIYSKKSEIIQLIDENQVVVLTAETGSGKSTQIVQYLHQMYSDQTIVCTQPRKVAAISLAKRVSEELSSKLGEIVGYRVGGRSEGTKQTSIYFVTDHLLLNECLKDRLLSSYKYIIVDEAHERSIATDLLLSMIKKALYKRSELRLIISSATINPEIFMTYFNNTSVNLHVHGSMFPVEEIYEEVSVGMNYLPVAISKAMKIHLEEKAGDILVFLTTPSETEKAQETLQKDTSIHMDIECLVLHGRLQAEEQQKIFDPTPPGKRKIVFATNSAETSITVPNIRYVIDCGMVKEKKYDQDRNISLLKVGPINKSSAVQRKGRAGRTQDGKCFRLYTKEEFEAMKDEMLPEILRENLGVALLKLYQLGIENPIEYDFVEPPKEESLNTAMQELKELGAVEGNTLTRYGKTMASLTIEPKLGKFVALSIDEGFGMDAMVCAAICSVGSSVFFRGSTDDDRQASDRLKVPFCHSGGDMMTILAVYKEWITVKDNQKKEWCIRNSMNAKTLRYTKDLVREMKASAEFVLNIRITDEFVQNADLEEFWLPYFLAECFKHNIAYFSGHARGGYFRLEWGRERFFLHPSSAFSLLDKTPKWIVFTEILNTSRQYVINATEISDEIVQQLCLTSFTPLIVLVKQYIVGKATRKRLDFGRIVCFLEVQMQKSIHPDIYIDYNSSNGRVSLFSNPKCKERAVIELNNVVMKEQEHFEDQLIDIPLCDGNPLSIVLGKGGMLKYVLEEGEFNAILLQDVDKSVTKEDIEKTFSKYGTLSEVIQFKPGNFTWGKVVYAKKRDAMKLMQDCKSSATLQKFRIKPAYNLGGEITMKSNIYLDATWARREGRGFAFLTFPEKTTVREFAKRKQIRLGKKLFSVYPSSKSEFDLQISGIDAHLREEELLTSFAVNFPEIKVTNCFIPRSEKHFETDFEIQDLRDELSDAIGMRIGQETRKRRDYSVEIYPIKSSKDFDYRATIRFTRLKDSITIQSSVIKIGQSKIQFMEKQQSISMPVILKDTVYRLVRKEFHTRLQRDFPEVSLVVSKRQSKTILKLDSENKDQLQRARTLLQTITHGQGEMFSESQIKYFTTPFAKEFIRILSEAETCVIDINHRLRAVVVYGEKVKRKEVAERMRKKAEQIDKYYKRCQLSLREQPIGFIKILLRRYGSDLKKLYEESGASFLNINFLSQELEVTGSTESIQKAKEILSKISEDMLGVKKERSEEGDCPVCFGSLETTSHQLEICSHSYCKECVQMLIESGVRNKQLPLACVKEGCDKLISIQDITEFIDIEEIVPVAVEKYVSKTKKYQYCITPNCLNIYKVSLTPNETICTVCEVSICTCCHKKYHPAKKCKRPK